MHAAGESTPALRFHHTGCLVADIEVERTRLAAIGVLGPVSPIFDVVEQDVRVCFIGPIDGPCIEIVQPLREKGTLPNLLRRGHHFYHVAYCADRYDAACAELEQRGVRRVNEFISAAFGGARCAFFIDEGGLLFEIIDSGARAAIAPESRG